MTSAAKARLNGFCPKVLLILGSGLGSLADAVEDPIAVPYDQVPHMKRSTAPDHAGQFVFGRLAGTDVAVMQGRLHTYEGWSYADVSFPVRVVRLLGARVLLVTNAAGAVNTSFSPALQDVARQCAASLGIPLRQGVYMFFPGPQYETPAEVRAARLLGADAVGMSTVPEAITAAHCGMDVLGFTLCTNMAAGVLDQPLSGEEVIAAGQAAGPRFSALVKACLARL